MNDEFQPAAALPLRRGDLANVRGGFDAYLYACYARCAHSRNRCRSSAGGDNVETAMCEIRYEFCVEGCWYYPV
jgi:hypothetical protein